MSDDGCAVILLRLENLDTMLNSIYDEVKRTKRRVTELEMIHAQELGRAESRKVLTMVLGTVLSGGILAAIIWFMRMAI